MRWTDRADAPTIIPDLDYRRCYTDRGSFVSVNMGWKIKRERHCDGRQFINGCRCAKGAHLLKSSLTLRLVGPVAITSISNRRRNSMSIAVWACDIRRSRCLPRLKRLTFDLRADVPILAMVSTSVD